MMKYLRFALLSLPFLLSSHLDAFSYPNFEVNDLSISKEKIDEQILKSIISFYASSNKESIMESSLDEEGGFIELSFRIDGELSHTVFISVNKEKYLFGDINLDGSEDVIATIGLSAGNIVDWDIFTFLLDKGGRIIANMHNDSGSISGCDRGLYFPEQIVNGWVIGRSQCYAVGDPNCCPSLEYTNVHQYIDYYGLSLAAKRKK
jgi:hypothetical protein